MEPIESVAGIVPGSGDEGVMRRARSSPLGALRIELVCLREFGYFIRRHRRYLLVALALYRYSLSQWRQARLLRAAYCLVQHVDDVLDGDRRTLEDPRRHVRSLLEQARSTQPACLPSLGRLAHFVMGELGKLRSDRDDPLGDMTRLIDVLMRDRERSDGRLLMSAEELAEHHRRTFHHSANLMLILARAELRAADAVELVGALSWCSPLRDLEEDLARGLVNIPASVVEQARMQGAAGMDYQSLIATHAVREWVRQEYERGVRSIEALGRKLETLRDGRSRTILACFHKALLVYARGYRQRHRDLISSPDASRSPR